MTIARPQRSEAPDIGSEDIFAIGRAVDQTPLEESLVAGYIASRPEFFQPESERTMGLGISSVAVDTGGLVSAMLFAASLQSLTHGHGSGRAALVALERLLVCLPVLLALLAASRHRLTRQLETSLAKQIHDVGLPLGAGALACLAAWRLLTVTAGVVAGPMDGLLVTAVVGTCTVAAMRTAWHVPARRNGIRARRVVVVGSGLVADRITARMEASGRVRVVGFVDDDPQDPTGCLGGLADLADVCAREEADHVVVAFTRSPAEAIVDALRTVQGQLPYSVVPRLFDVLPTTAHTQELASGYPAMSVGVATLGWWPRAAKRTMDVIGGCVVLMLALPVLAVAALGVRLSSRGPVFLRQTRVGLNGREFSVFKLRTFTVTESSPPPEVLEANENVTGPFPKLKDDPRTTSFGRILRRTSIDELPQVLNVLSGTMALVGPRPLQPEFAWSFGTWALRRYAVKPGLTGLWQVSGRNDLTYEEMCRLDNLYVASWSVGLDVRILARTMKAVVSGRGCY